MAELGLVMGYDELIKHIAFARNWGFTAYSSLSADRLEICEEILKGGLRQFYNPHSIREGIRPHEWSFLKPMATLTTSASGSGTATTGTTGTTVVATDDVFDSNDVGAMLTFTLSENAYRIVAYTDATTVTIESALDDDDVYVATGLAFTIGTYCTFDLPDDFASLDDVLTYPPTTGYPPVQVVGESFIRSKQQHSVAQGRPVYAAVRAKRSDLSTGQRFQIMFYPWPDQGYVLTYKYRAAQDELAHGEYPLGGADHSETILASCLAWAEINLDDVTDGPKSAQYTRRLESSISTDQSLGHADFLGRMRNPERGSSRARSPGVIVTYNGVDYS
jgi:hypothetical protein